MRKLLLACILALPGFTFAQKTVKIEGGVDRAPSATPAIFVNPLFLEDAKKTSLPVSGGKFAAEVKVESPEAAVFTVNGKSFPV